MTPDTQTRTNKRFEVIDWAMKRADKFRSHIPHNKFRENKLYTRLEALCCLYINTGSIAMIASPLYSRGVKECRRVQQYTLLGKIDEGTFGMVFRARDKSSGSPVALKRVKFGRENVIWGYPLSSIREINIISSLQHPNIINILEVVVAIVPEKFFIVLEFMDHDLKSLVENMKQNEYSFTTSEVKNIMVQLLSGIAYLHENWVLHRDVKTSNILYNNLGEIKLCDFGLARQYSSPVGRYTPNVITPCYRPPELFLAEEKYSTEVDVWSCGCIMAELFTKTPLFEGKGEIEIINKIFAVMGSPSKTRYSEQKEPRSWKSFKCRFKKSYQLCDSGLFTFMESRSVLTKQGLDLLEQLLCVDPKWRISAWDALNHPWFNEAPLPKSNGMMPTFPSTAVRKLHSKSARHMFHTLG